jgi:WD repeat-containing protein 35
LKKKAEIAAYFQKFDNAEKIYLEMDRKDLAMDLRCRMGDWFRVAHLIKAGGAGDDLMLKKVWEKIGDYYFDRQLWYVILLFRKNAIHFYSQCRNTEKLISISLILEDFEQIEKLSTELSENSPHLKVTPYLKRKLQRH